MDLTESAKIDRSFLAEHGCTPEHFLVLDMVRTREFRKARTVIEQVNWRNSAERFWVEMYAEVAFRSGDFNLAAFLLESALKLKYRCPFTDPAGGVPFAKPELVVDAITLHKLAIVYARLKRGSVAEQAEARSTDLMRESVVAATGYPEQQLPEIAARIFAPGSLWESEGPLGNASNLGHP